MADFLEQENRLLKEELATMQAKMNEMAAAQTQVDELTELVRTLRAAQNQPPLLLMSELRPKQVALLSLIGRYVLNPQHFMRLHDLRLGSCPLLLVKYSALLLANLRCLLFNIQYMFLLQTRHALKLL